VLIIHQHAVSDHFTTAARVEPDDPRTDPLLVDVRGAPETATGTLPGAIEIPLAVLADSLDALDRDRPVVVYCASGYRSVVASSVLVQAGFADVSDLLGGFGAWQSAGLPVARPGDLADLRHAPQVSARTARSLLDAGAALLAVREPGEWYDGHVPGAIPMPMGEVQSRRGELPAATRIVVVCRSGGRSAAIAAALCTQGFDAVNLTGGMCAWQAAGFPVVTRPAVPALEPGEAHRQAAEHGMVVHRDDPLNVETSISALIGGVVMPNARFHVRNHFRTPAIDTGTWTLEITGLVERPLALSLRDLSRLPSETRLVTLECAGNGRSAFNPPVGGEAWRLGAVSTAEWTGVPLDHVLDRVGVLPAATEVVFRGADHGAIEGRPGTIYFERSLSVETARGAQALLAYVMNGERVPMQHGYPSGLWCRAGTVSRR
jgi:rhodanese-related sulfurtransferase/DMSO/TMAO reductase YedYZ molybdopterin-dependent catalytic subunit